MCVATPLSDSKGGVFLFLESSSLELFGAPGRTFFLFFTEMHPAEDKKVVLLPSYHSFPFLEFFPLIVNRSGHPSTARFISPLEEIGSSALR